MEETPRPACFAAPKGKDYARAQTASDRIASVSAPKCEESRDRDPKGNSLWLLPSGPDQIGEAFARDLRGRYDDFGSRMQVWAC